MTTKEKVIRESIKRIAKKINGIRKILDANPLSEIIELERKTIHEAKQLKNPVEALRLITEAMNKKAELMKVAKKQQNSIKLINEKVKLEFELSDLNMELWHIQIKRDVIADS